MELDDLIAAATERLPDEVARKVVERLNIGREEYERDDGTQPIMATSLFHLLDEATEELVDAIVYLNVIHSRSRQRSPIVARALALIIKAHDEIVLARRSL